ncbi:MAG: hypothetical protein FWH55_10940 [Oscillospiraceae bacterium]|nr:hypothetical protein [Oscillospiraceae bacterium]
MFDQSGSQAWLHFRKAMYIIVTTVVLGSICLWASINSFLYLSAEDPIAATPLSGEPIAFDSDDAWATLVETTTIRCYVDLRDMFIRFRKQDEQGIANKNSWDDFSSAFSEFMPNIEDAKNQNGTWYGFYNTEIGSNNSRGYDILPFGSWSDVIAAEYDHPQLDAVPIILPVINAMNSHRTEYRTDHNGDKIAYYRETDIAVLLTADFFSGAEIHSARNGDAVRKAFGELCNGRARVDGNKETVRDNHGDIVWEVEPSTIVVISMKMPYIGVVNDPDRPLYFVIAGKDTKRVSAFASSLLDALKKFSINVVWNNASLTYCSSGIELNSVNNLMRASIYSPPGMFHLIPADPRSDAQFVYKQKWEYYGSNALQMKYLDGINTGDPKVVLYRVCRNDKANDVLIEVPLDDRLSIHIDGDYTGYQCTLAVPSDLLLEWSTNRYMISITIEPIPSIINQMQWVIDNTRDTWFRGMLHEDINQTYLIEDYFDEVKNDPNIVCADHDYNPNSHQHSTCWKDVKDMDAQFDLPVDERDYTTTMWLTRLLNPMNFPEVTLTGESNSMQLVLQGYDIDRSLYKQLRWASGNEITDTQGEGATNGTEN